jgi:site-specific recombinase XerD
LGKRNHSKHGWFESSPHSYQKLVDDYPEVQTFSQSFSDKSRSGYLYALEFYLSTNNLTPTEALALPDEEIKKSIIKAVIKKQESGAHASGRRIYYALKRFFELFDREVRFNRTQRRTLMKWSPVKVAKQHIPSKSEIYRAVDAVPKKDMVQQLKTRSILLSLWQSGVRGSCLCSWKYGMFRGKLDNDVTTIKVVANRPRGVHNVAVDTKLSGYKLSHYFTFLGKEAVLALREYIEARKKYDSWEPKDSVFIYVTTGTVSRGKKLNAKHLNDVVKTAFGQIGIPEDSVWTHLLRKSFRKTLYKSGVEPDVAEALMGHKLSGSRTAYFDFADTEFLKAEYAKANWERYPIKELESKISKMEENGKSKDKRIQELEKQLAYFKSQDFVTDLMKNLSESGITFEVKKSSKPKKVLREKVKLVDGKRLAELMRKGYSPVYSDNEIWILEKEID